MSIPLDCLYHYIEDTANTIRGDHTLIYRFYPHGSKKLTDLTATRNISNDWEFNMTHPMMICHDQEPLNFNLYQTDPILTNHIENFIGVPENNNVRQLYTDMHIRALLPCPLNAYDAVLLCHSEKNSSELNQYQDHNFIGVYWWSHAIIARDWFRYAYYDNTLAPNFETIKNDFLIYNRAWSGTREYRLKFCELLANQKLISKCNIAFAPVDNNIHYTNHKFKNNSLSIGKNNFEKLYKTNTSLSTSSADYIAEDYCNSAIEVVLETLFDDARLHLTEKILRPIACGKPFILAGTAGSLNYLRDYGFKTFHGLIDESYDTVSDPLLRLTCIVKEMKRISSLDTVSKNFLWKELYKISSYNRQLFFSDKFEQQILSELADNLHTGISQLESSKKASYMLKLRTLKKQNPELQHLTDSKTIANNYPTQYDKIYKILGIEID